MKNYTTLYNFVVRKSINNIIIMFVIAFILMLFFTSFLTYQSNIERYNLLLNEFNYRDNNYIDYGNFVIEIKSKDLFISSFENINYNEIIEKDHFYENGYYYFVRELGENKIVLLSINYLKMHKLLFYLITIFFLVLLIIVCITYVKNKMSYSTIKNTFHEIYLNLKEMGKGNFDTNIKFTNINELNLIIKSIKDISSLYKDKREFILQNTNYYKEVLNGIPMPIIFYDLEYKYLDSNEQSKKIFSNKNLEDIINISVLDDYLDKEKCEIELAKKNIKINVENIKIYKNEKYYSLLAWNNDSPKYKKFVSNTAHELRSPLNLIIGFSDIMLQGIEGELSDSIKEEVTAINSAGKELLRMINEIVFISKDSYIDGQDSESFVTYDDIDHLFKALLFGYIKHNRIQLFNNLPKDYKILIKKKSFLHLIAHCIYDVFDNYEEIYIFSENNEISISSYDTQKVQIDFGNNTHIVNKDILNISDNLNIRLTYLKNNDNILIGLKKN